MSGPSMPSKRPRGDDSYRETNVKQPRVLPPQPSSEIIRRTNMFVGRTIILGGSILIKNQVTTSRKPDIQMSFSRDATVFRTGQLVIHINSPNVTVSSTRPIVLDIGPANSSATGSTVSGRTKIGTIRLLETNSLQVDAPRLNVTDFRTESLQLDSNHLSLTDFETESLKAATNQMNVTDFGAESLKCDTSQLNMSAFFTPARADGGQLILSGFTVQSLVVNTNQLNMNRFTAESVVAKSNQLNMSNFNAESMAVSTDQLNMNRFKAESLSVKSTGTVWRQSNVDMSENHSTTQQISYNQFNWSTTNVNEIMEVFKALTEATNKNLTDVELKRNCPICGICLEEILPWDEVEKISCAHVFHQTCLSPWLQLKSTCPTCRRDVKQQ